jgi:acetyl-CoA carboxylase carboxyl transferase subunit alpha
LKITAPDLLKLNIIDEIVPEPVGGAHMDAEQAARLLDGPLERTLRELQAVPLDACVQKRYDKFRNMGALGQAFVDEG